MKIGLAAAVVVGMAVPVMAQTTGVSHPEQVPITSSPEDSQAPAGYVPTPVRTLTVRPTTIAEAPAYVSVEPKLVSSEPNPDGMIVGDDIRKPLSVPDVDANIVTRVEGSSNELPAGTLVKARIAQSLTTIGTLEGSVFSAELTEAVLRDGRVLLPAGSVMSGRVTDVHGGRRITGGASIHLQPTSVTLPDGTHYKLYAQVVDTNRFHHVKVDSEGTMVRRDPKMSTPAVLGLATGSGAAAGAVFGGWPGALIGGAIGAGIGTAVWLKQDRQEEIPAGTKIVFSLTSAMVFGGE